MIDRITGDLVRRSMSKRFWIGRDTLASQLDADANAGEYCPNRRRNTQ